MVPGRGGEAAAGGVLGVQPDLDGVAVGVDVVLGEAEGLARRHPELPLDEVEAGDELGHGVLDLEPGVHLQEEEVAVLVEELDGPGVHVAAGLGHRDRRRPHGPADLVGEGRGRGSPRSASGGGAGRSSRARPARRRCRGCRRRPASRCGGARPGSARGRSPTGRSRPGPHAGPTPWPRPPRRDRRPPSSPGRRRRRRP